LVFNLVESLGGTDRLMPLATLLLDALGVPYTGCLTASLLQTGDKLAAKRKLRSARLPTPGWLQHQATGRRRRGARKPAATAAEGFAPRRYIIKAVFEHASLGMDDAAVVEVTSAAELRQLVRDRSRELGRICFAERYVEGREFNISLLDYGRGEPQVLPHAEILFKGFAADRPHIVGYRAKWAEDSAEYQGTPRRFDMPDSDQPLLRRLTRLSIACWRLFGLRGYARVDFRVDAAGRPWILEVNANPCLSPDAGFAAALDAAGIGFTAAIGRIIDAAVLATRE
jgi:D-alanine-D-alanine ligase